MKTSLFLIIVAISLLWGGGQGLFTAITNLKPKEYAVEEYLNHRPSAKWLRLKGGVVDLTGLTYSSFLGVGTITEIYVPIRPSTASSNDEVHILFATKEPSLLAKAEKLRQLRTESEALRYLQAHRDELIFPRELEGLIRFGIEFKDRDERWLRTHNENLADDFVVLADGERPEFMVYAFLFLGGVAVSGWILKNLFGVRAKPPGSQPPPLPPRLSEVPPLLNPK